MGTMIITVWGSTVIIFLGMCMGTMTITVWGRTRYG